MWLILMVNLTFCPGGAYSQENSTYLRILGGFMNFYEHEDRVKIIDHILSHEQNWDWFIELTEKTFEVELNSTSIIEAQNSFRDVRDVFFF